MGSRTDCLSVVYINYIIHIYELLITIFFYLLSLFLHPRICSTNSSVLSALQTRPNTTSSSSTPLTLGPPKPPLFNYSFFLLPTLSCLSPIRVFGAVVCYFHDSLLLYLWPNTYYLQQSTAPLFFI